MEFHWPQSWQRPTHFGDWLPQFWQEYMVLTFGAFITGHNRRQEEECQ